MATRHNYAEKGALGRAQEELARPVKELSRVGHKVETLNALCEVSLSQNDKVPVLVNAADHMKLSDMEAMRTPG